MNEVDHENCHEKVLSFRIDKAFTYGDMRPGHKDRDKREEIRRAALKASAGRGMEPSRFKSWMFRIQVYKSRRRQFDIENVPKLFIDAFCARQIEEDGSTSTYKDLALYEDDTIDYVNRLEVHGERIGDNRDEHIDVEILGKRASA